MIYTMIGKEARLAMFARERGKEQFGLRQHLLDINVLGVIAEAQFTSRKLPEEWEPIQAHVSLCEDCQYDVSNIIAALEIEQEAIFDYLGFNDRPNT